MTHHEDVLYEIAAAGETFTRDGVDVSFAPVEVWLWKEDGPSVQGAVCRSPAQVTDARWDSHFRAADGEWARPLLQRLLAGEDVATELLDGYAQRHGTPPPRRPRHPVR